MKVKVDADLCTGCELCIDTCPEVFVMKDDISVPKAEEAGRTVTKVDPRYTSQICSGCGEIVKKDLSVRVHDCPYCNLVLDRDVNAAKNILNKALRLDEAVVA